MRERGSERDREESREKERSEEQRSRRGGGAQFRQEIPAEKVGLRPNYTALCQRVYTNAHVHAYTLTITHTDTDLFCSSLSARVTETNTSVLL